MPGLSPQIKQMQNSYRFIPTLGIAQVISVYTKCGVLVLDWNMIAKNWNWYGSGYAFVK